MRINGKNREKKWKGLFATICGSKTKTEKKSRVKGLFATICGSMTKIEKKEWRGLFATI